MHHRNRGQVSSSFLCTRVWLCAFAAVLLCADLASAQLRVMNYNLAQLRGNPSALQAVFAAAHADDKPGFAVPVSIFVFQEVQSTQTTTILNLLNAAAPPGVTYAMATYTSNGFEDNSGGAQALYYRVGMVNENAPAHLDISTGGGRNTDRWVMRLTGYNSPFSWMYIYGSHLKADTGAANQQERLDGVIAIRNNSDVLGAGLHIIYCGDMNFYTNAEPGYLHFFSGGNGQAFDPLGTGSWTGSASPPNSANNYKHTQSPLSAGVNGLVGGGMNSRFDFQLSNGVLHDNAGLSMISGTYRALGNDGLHYNLAIDTGTNGYYPGQRTRSNALAANLRLASDHIPLIVDYQIPAMMAGSMLANYGRVIVGTQFSVDLDVTNPANATVVFGADELNYTATGSIGLSGVVSDTVQPLGDVSPASFALNTATAAIRNGTVTITSTSPGVQPTSLVLNTTGTVVRPSNASFSNAADENSLTLPLAFDADSGVQNFNVNVHNFGFDALQAKLDIDDVTGTSIPFAYIGGAGLNIGSTPASLSFSIDTTGLSAGQYTAPVTIHTSDEDIPGESVTALDLNIIVTIQGEIPCASDITSDGMVNVNDLLAVINAWGSCANCPADLNDDGLVNVNDLLAVINAWGACP